MDLLERTETQDSDTDDSDKVAHYAAAAEVTEGYIMGTPVNALCGVVFIPTKNPEKMRVCPSCKEIVEALYLNIE